MLNEQMYKNLICNFFTDQNEKVYYNGVKSTSNSVVVTAFFSEPEPHFDTFIADTYETLFKTTFSHRLNEYLLSLEPEYRFQLVNDLEKTYPSLLQTMSELGYSYRDILLEPQQEPTPATNEVVIQIKELIEQTDINQLSGVGVRCINKLNRALTYDEINTMCTLNDEQVKELVEISENIWCSLSDSNSMSLVEVANRIANYIAHGEPFENNTIAEYTKEQQDRQFNKLKNSSFDWQYDLVCYEW